MLFARLLISPMPHARVKKLDLRAALAMPGVKAIVTADDIPAPAATVTDLGQTIQANMKGERALTNAFLIRRRRSGRGASASRRSPPVAARF